MKRFYIAIVILFSMILFACGESSGGSGGSGYVPAKLNLIEGNKTFIKSSEILSQVTSSSSKSFNKAPSDIPEIKEVTTEEGDPVEIGSAVRVNSNYIFLKELRISGEEEILGDFILDINTGNLTELSFYPSNPDRIVCNNTHAFYINEGTIYSVEFSSGTSTMINSSSTYNYSPDIITPCIQYESAWDNRTFLYLDANDNLFAINSTKSDYVNGMGEKFVFSGNTWAIDSTFNHKFLTGYSSQRLNEIMGITSIGTQIGTEGRSWIVLDKENKKVYRIIIGVTPKTKMSVSEWDVENGIEVENSEIIKELATEMTEGTLIGSDNSLGNFVITDGITALKFEQITDNVINDISIPVDVITTSASGSPFTIVNWNYLDGLVYFTDSENRYIYTWNFTSVAGPVSEVNNIEFID